MKDKMKGLLRKGANAALNTDFVRSKLIEFANASKLARYGTVEQLVLDLEQGSIHMGVRLAGEAEAIQVNLTNFEIVGDDVALKLVILELEIDREWIQRLAADKLIGRPQPIPEEYAKLAKKLRGLFS